MRYVKVDLEDVKRWKAQDAVVLGVIRELWGGRREGTISLNRMSEYLGIERPTAQAAVRRLIKNGILEDLTPDLYHAAHTYRFKA